MGRYSIAQSAPWWPLARPRPRGARRSQRQPLASRLSRARASRPAPLCRPGTSADLQAGDLLAVELEPVSDRHRAARKFARQDDTHRRLLVGASDRRRLGVEVILLDRLLHPRADRRQAAMLLALVLHDRIVGEGG